MLSTRNSFVTLLRLRDTDIENPVITCPINQTIKSEQNKAHATVVWTDPQVTDNSGQVPTITCDAESGSQFGIGETEVTCQVVDPAGDQAMCMFTVSIYGKKSMSK